MYDCRMSRPPDYMYRMSEALSEVMDDIGVNEKLVMETQEYSLLLETVDAIMCKRLDISGRFMVGSRGEGSTTEGLQSDFDNVHPIENSILIQHMCEWKPGLANYMMIQNENIQPGHCFAQRIRSDRPIPVTANDMIRLKKGNYAVDNEGRVLEKNFIEPSQLIHNFTVPLQQNGPALTLKILGHVSQDIVACFCCKSSPLQATPWLQKLTESKWPSEDVKILCRNAGCFVVSVGSKLSDMPKNEWRISTGLQERYHMFNLNITQLRCYVLMKMILKTHINPYVEDVLSSFMCKNVLLFCVYNSSHESSQEWHTGNLLSYLHLCLFMLKERILQRNCPHLMIQGNNLLTGRMTDTQRAKLLDIIDNLMEDKEELLYEMQIDDLSARLMMKFKPLSSSPKLQSATGIAAVTLGNMIIRIAYAQRLYIMQVLKTTYKENLEVTQQNIFELLSDLKKERARGNLKKQNACDLLIPSVKSALGLVMASISIDAQTAISDEAFTYLEAGRESDVLSGRLKLASVLYCTGGVKRAEQELRIIQKPKFGFSSCCFKVELQNNKSGFVDYNFHKHAFRYGIAFCTRFLKCEINCVPHELRYEILRSYLKEDRKNRTMDESMWMDLIVVDSVPYLYFLQYKTYGLLQRRTEQLEALFELEKRIEIEPKIGHKETALNLLGQCLEQEKRRTKAVHCYIRSLKHRERNNAARFLLCIHLLKLWKKYNV